MKINPLGLISFVNRLITELIINELNKITR